MNQQVSFTCGVCNQESIKLMQVLDDEGNCVAYRRECPICEKTNQQESGETV